MSIKNRISHILILIGRQELSSEHLPWDERILYLDYVPNQDLPKFYSYAVLLVHNSLSEGFGFTPIEAMACGIPVLSSNRGAWPEVGGDAGILFDHLDCDLLSRLMLDVINNERMRKELITRGLERVKKFTWERTAEGILDCCEKAVKRNSTT